MPNPLTLSRTGKFALCSLPSPSFIVRFRVEGGMFWWGVGRGGLSNRNGSAGWPETLPSGFCGTRLALHLFGFANACNDDSSLNGGQ
ncbi:FK506-binding protein 15 [Anopheles sinensis]|uniref:FK506-binding protein 15 n=1 Tax=Anopheles sinensis TaxID=74873 RepID=A0A084VVC8_ANOSI|nr:FK506-binding protein 15 [Anopheles sinensis]